MTKTFTGNNDTMWDHGVLIESAHITIMQGIIAGLCGGVAMALAMTALSIAVGQGPWQMPKRLAGVVLGPKAKDGGAGVVAFGLAIHVALSAGFGALFSIVVDRLTHEFWMTGVAYALTLWVLNYWGSQITPGGRELTELKTSWLSPLAHIVYGGVLAAVALSTATR
jgi:hypothetical protein